MWNQIDLAGDTRPHQLLNLHSLFEAINHFMSGIQVQDLGKWVVPHIAAFPNKQEPPYMTRTPFLSLLHLQNSCLPCQDPTNGQLCMLTWLAGEGIRKYAKIICTVRPILSFQDSTHSMSFTWHKRYKNYSRVSHEIQLKIGSQLSKT